MCHVSMDKKIHSYDHPADSTFSADIANFMYSNPSLLDLELQGFWISDRKSIAHKTVDFQNPDPMSCSLDLVRSRTRTNSCSRFCSQIRRSLLVQVRERIEIT